MRVFLLTADESFYEGPDDVHIVGRNHWPKRKQYKTSKICGVLSQEQRRSGVSASEVITSARLKNK
jgi:hypothetical protein